LNLFALGNLLPPMRSGFSTYRHIRSIRRCMADVSALSEWRGDLLAQAR
jgi:hypothetical protein